MTNILPTQTVPDFTVPLIDGGEFKLSEQLGENFTLLVFYRGVHCPICKMQLTDLQGRLGDFNDRGVKVFAISMDSQERAQKSSDEWDIKDVTLGYGLSEDQARELDLYISSGRPDSKEPEIFSEPGLLLVKPDQTLYFASIQSMPFTRPPFDELLKGIDYAMENDYPARGELAKSR